MHRLLALLTGLAIAALPAPGALRADAHDTDSLYAVVHCMQAKAPTYVALERDIWLPMHAERVERGLLNSWSLYATEYGDRSDCSHYTVETYRGREQLNAAKQFDEIFAAVHRRKDFEASMAATWGARRHVSSWLWRLVDSTGIAPHRYAIVNLMRADDPVAYERMESRVFKAGHEVLLEGGHRAGWSIYALVSPGGTDIPYNYSTVDFVDHLNPVPMAEAMMAAHPDRDIEAMHDLLELREQVRSETWTLLVTTNDSR
ncbi:MAG: hypothetical protein KJO76_05265 [Gammaproteobacteria bacterium]|nr:hypothetical protein [Gammaproteobacteria bacterium]